MVSAIILEGVRFIFCFPSLAFQLVGGSTLSDSTS